MREPSPTTGRRLLVRGRVQEVGFRHFTALQARELELAGWVRNLPDGRVEIEAGGSPEALDELETRVRRGPSWSQVDGVESQALSTPPQERPFQIKA